MNDHQADKPRHLLYRFSNPSLGPVDGRMEVYLTLRNGKVVEARDVKSGRQVPLEVVMGLNDFLRALHHKTKDLKVRYDRDGLPMHILHPGAFDAEGGRYTIEIVPVENTKE